MLFSRAFGFSPTKELASKYRRISSIATKGVCVGLPTNGESFPRTGYQPTGQ